MIISNAVEKVRVLCGCCDETTVDDEGDGKVD